MSVRYCSNNNKHNNGDCNHINTSEDNNGSYFYSINFIQIYIFSIQNKLNLMCFSVYSKTKYIVM